MREPKCLVCQEPSTRIAVDELASKGGTVRSIAGQVKRSRSSIHRHLQHNGREKTGASVKDGAGAASSQARRLSGGRCATCGLSMTETDAQSLLRRAERILWIAETIAAQAQRDDDARLALQAVDRARSSLETMMRATGLIGGDASITVQVDARRQVMATLGKLSIDEIRALASGDPANALSGEVDAEVRGLPNEEADSRNDVPK